MAWVYLDDQFPDHPKVARAGGDAGWMFVCGLAYVRRHETGGLIPAAQVARLTDRRQPQRLAERLVAVDLWEVVDDEHYAVHDYHEWNKPQESRSAAGRKAAQARWGKRNATADANASETHMRNDEIADASGCPPPHPHPYVASTPPPSPLSRDATGGGESIDAVLTQAATLLAEAEAVRRGNAIGNPGGYIRARTPAIRAEHEPEWRRLLEHAPALTAEQLAHGQPDATADRALIERNARRRNGTPDCDRCEDRGVIELDDDTFGDCPCKTKASA